MVVRLAVLFCLFFLPATCFSQGYSVKGIIDDNSDNSAIIGVTVLLVNQAGTADRNGTVTDVNGAFMLSDVKAGKYSLQITYVGYKSLRRPVIVTNQSIDLGTLKMTAGSNELKGVTVREKQIRAEQLGDTSQFRADAFKTHPDATAEDLVNKMPGVSSDNTGVKVNGETVQQVTVDGKPFFGTDPTLALKNLPAEVIDKIQVFDKLSDQSAFTGFDDGSSQKTLNIVTRKNKSEGVFGKIYAGYGTDDRYIAGGNINIFNGSRRISLLGLSNNINQQNFSSQDILGAVGSGSGQNRGGGSGGRGNFGGGGGNGANNFLVGQQGGISTTNAFGFNYSDNWGKKMKVTGSYFFNGTDNTNVTDLTRNYFTSSDSTNVYHESDNSDAKNYNHRVNLRFEYTIDSFNSIIFTPGVSFQKNNSSGSTFANDSIADVTASATSNKTASNSSGYTSSNNLLFQHKFGKPRRTISLNVGSNLNEKSGDGSYYSSTQYGAALPFVRDQHYNLYNNSYSLSPNVTYTEPVSKKGQLLINYSPSVTKSRSDKETYNKDSAQEYVNLDPLFSNKYDNTYSTQKGGISYRVGDRKLNFNIGANVQYATLIGDQQYPKSISLSRNFISVLPSSFFNYRFADGRNLRIMYRANTIAPTVTQLQDVVDISNPLLLKTGNADLKQDYEQTFFLRYGLTQAKTAHNFFINIYANYINNYIGNATYIPSRDSSFTDPVTKTATFIKGGAQLTRPVNLDGYINTRTFITYGIPAQFIKSNLNLNGGFNFTRTPGLVNSNLNFANNYIPSFGVVLSSNVSEKLDFTLSYNGNYNIVKNTAQSRANNDYYNHAASFKINWIFLKNFVLNTNISENYYTAFSSTGDQNFFLWNAYLGYKLLKNNALEARLTAYDILNQNKSISRTVTETYIENSVTRVLQQYFMLQLTYTLRNFKGAPPVVTQPSDNEEMNLRSLRDGNRPNR